MEGRSRNQTPHIREQRQRRVERSCLNCTILRHGTTEPGGGCYFTPRREDAKKIREVGQENRDKKMVRRKWTHAKAAEGAKKTIFHTKGESTTEAQARSRKCRRGLTRRRKERKEDDFHVK